MPNTNIQPILCTIDANGVAEVTLNRPDKHNAFNDEMVHLLTEIFQNLQTNPTVKIIVLKSEGKNFSSGADLTWMQSMAQYSEAENLKDALALDNMLHTLYTCEKPIIGQVQGHVFGGGIGLVACCHIVIAAQNTAFCFSEVKLGLIPAVISPYIIQAIGSRWARYYFLTAERFSAEKALSLGLCHQVTLPEELETHTKAQIALLQKNGPQALMAVNRLFNHLPRQNIDKTYREQTAKAIAQIRVSKEGQEGLKAFLEKRLPNWIVDT